MAVETNEFRVVGVDKDTGADVSVVIEAATKAAAEVKAEKLNIDTTHIVRMKRHDDPPADEHVQYALDAAEARSTTPTDKLIEEIIEPETPRETPAPAPAAAAASQPERPAQSAPPPVVLAAVSRPAYTSPIVKLTGSRPTAASALLFVLAVLLGIAGGGYYVLIHEPNAAIANDLLPPDQLFDARTSAPPDTTTIQQQRLNNPNAFSQRNPGQRAAPVAPLQNPPTQHTPTTPNTNANPAPAGTPATNRPATTPPAQAQARPASLELQSVVVSHEGRFAVINGKLIAQGGTIAGCTLVNVADDWAMLDKDGEQFVIRIEAGGAAE